MEAQRKAENGSQPDVSAVAEEPDAKKAGGIEYQINVEVGENVNSIEIAPPLTEEHESALTKKLDLHEDHGPQESPFFINDGDSSVLYIEPIEPLSSNASGFEQQEAEQLISQEAIERGKQIAIELLKLENVQVIYGPDIQSDQLPVAA